MHPEKRTPLYALSVKAERRPEPYEILACVADVCRQVREELKLDYQEMSYEVRASRSVLSRFENLESRPDRLDDIVAGYETAGGLEPAELWQRAVELKRERLRSIAAAS